MSAAIRKRSWEEHVGGQPPRSGDGGTACRHGLVADGARGGMEGGAAADVDGTETLVPVPDEDADPEPRLPGDEQMLTTEGPNVLSREGVPANARGAAGESGPAPGERAGTARPSTLHAKARGFAIEGAQGWLPPTSKPRPRRRRRGGGRAVPALREALPGRPGARPEPVRLREKKEIRHDRDKARLDSMVLLIMKLDQLDQDIENALSASSTPSGTPTNLRRLAPDLESGSESGADTISVNQTHGNLPPNTGSTDTSPATTVSSSGTKPKATAVPSFPDKEKAEIEAKEACDWLRATGFPQYAQLYEDLLFPIDITLVKREHDFLDRDAIEALCRRLNTLNKCAVMKLEISPHRKRSEDSDEDEPCAISGRWTFQRDSQRWSRLEELDVFAPGPASPGGGEGPCAPGTLGGPRGAGPQPGDAGPARGLPAPAEPPGAPGRGDKSTKSRARSLLKRMESLRLRGGGPKARARPGPLIGAPVLQEGAAAQQRQRQQQPLRGRRRALPAGPRARRPPQARRPLPGGLRPPGAARAPRRRPLPRPPRPQARHLPRALAPGGPARPRRSSAGSAGSRRSVYDNVPGPGLLGSAWDLADPEGEDALPAFPELDDILCHVKGVQQIVNQWSEKFSDEGDSDSALDSVSPCPSSPKQRHLDGDPDQTTPSDLDSTGNSLNEPEEPADIPERRDSGVGASLTRCNRRRLRWHSFQSSHRPSLNSVSLQINCQSVAQMNLLQKYSLLKLTALLEKYTPSNKHGFSWAVPKFMKRIKVPDYKDRSVFGVPLTVNVQRSGQPLPQSIQKAMRYLRNHCLDQVGLFRKSGVKSRIQALRQMNEGAADGVTYEGQSAYDVADMLKQYFRDLPEPLMTNKLSETFLQIYQYVPKDQRLQALKAAIMLLPDENREVLQTLLYFLSDVTAAVKENQMTPTNLAVCLAPSLFHLNTLKRENSSPRVMQRKQSLGKPDQKDLNENLAATQGLAHMIAECKKLFQVPEEMNRCRNSYTEQELKPLTLEALGQLSDESADYKHFIQDCVDGLFKEVKEKFKGWVSYPTSEQAELSYKKVSEGPPLRLWRSTIEVPATPEEVLTRLLKEQHLWDVDLLDSKVIEILDSQTEIYQYVQNSMAPHPARDYVLLRTWRSNLPKGACALFLTSVDHDRAPVVGVRVNVLLSRYLIEPCGPGKSKLTYLCRADLRGRMPEWYTKSFGHLCAAEVVKIRDSFSNPNTDAKDGKSR
ncbi:rho GTPase-activating protein 7 [Perognathus longimembris pacificus]|uniref:rho GTPase-activating protein 7 n=1 Tax=Perognathus longimembris pacificus TaxID=214514 RepID=UPI0020198A03|nr:rho GTPase-activating protein 7 [Perognathus longimembris pacificus]